MTSQKTPKFKGSIKPENSLQNKAFSALILDAFWFPFQGHGPFILIGYALFNIILDLLKFLPLLGNFLLFPYFFFNLFLTALILNVLTNSADGDQGPPDWPNISDWREEILQPALRLIVTALICFGPVIFYNFYNPKAFNPNMTLPQYPAWTWVYSTAAAFYFPMGLLAVTLHDSLMVLNPYFVIKSIRRTFSAYLFICLVVLAAFALTGFLNLIPYGKYLSHYFLDIYFFLIVARILGLFYYRNQERLAWF
jgi:hypothetical protein